MGSNRYTLGARIAGALALVGWTVMIPPTICPNGMGCTPHYDPKAPVSEWELGRHFSKESECEDWLKEVRHQHTDLGNKREAEAMSCISDEAIRHARRKK